MGEAQTVLAGACSRPGAPSPPGSPRNVCPGLCTTVSCKSSAPCAGTSVLCWGHPLHSLCPWGPGLAGRDRPVRTEGGADASFRKN